MANCGEQLVNSRQYRTESKHYRYSGDGDGVSTKWSKLSGKDESAELQCRAFTLEALFGPLDTVVSLM